MKNFLQKWLDIDRLQYDDYYIIKDHKSLLKSNRELLDTLVNYQSQMCKNYTELNDKIKELEKELLELKNKKNNLNGEIYYEGWILILL